MYNEVMKIMTIRNVPDNVHDRMVELARRNRRSLQQQVLVIMERACELGNRSVLDTARGIRGRLAGRELGDTVRDIREDRER